jgi:hypothetical protein
MPFTIKPPLPPMETKSVDEILRRRRDKAPRQCTMDQVEGREGKSLAPL